MENLPLRELDEEEETLGIQSVLLMALNERQRMAECNRRISALMVKADKIKEIGRKIDLVLNKVRSDFDFFQEEILNEELRNENEDIVDEYRMKMNHMKHLLRQITEVCEHYESSTLPPIKERIMTEVRANDQEINENGTRIETLRSILANVIQQPVDPQNNFSEDLQEQQIQARPSNIHPTFFADSPESIHKTVEAVILLGILLTSFMKPKMKKVKKDKKSTDVTSDAEIRTKALTSTRDPAANVEATTTQTTSIEATTLETTGNEAIILETTGNEATTLATRGNESTTLETIENEPTVESSEAVFFSKVVENYGRPDAKDGTLTERIEIFNQKLEKLKEEFQKEMDKDIESLFEA